MGERRPDSAVGGVLHIRSGSSAAGVAAIGRVGAGCTLHRMRVHQVVCKCSICVKMVTSAVFVAGWVCSDSAGCAEVLFGLVCDTCCMHCVGIALCAVGRWVAVQ